MNEIIGNYQVVRTLYESDVSLIYAVKQRIPEENLPNTGILKLLASDYPSSDTIEQIKKEYEFLKLFDSDSIIRVYQMGYDNNRPFIYLEDFNAISIKSYLQQQHILSLDDFFRIAITTTQALAEVHHNNLIHKDINPNNILINPQTKTVKLIDFGLSTKLSREYPALKNPEHLEGTLAYLSPEQTGRMNRSLDYRTDFYSLGITFYELLSGITPFDDHDKLALVHAHLAKQVQPLHELNPKLPLCLSQLVMKLIAKQAEDRYQSAWGIQSDLEEIKNHLHDTEFLNSFVIARNDISNKFQLTQKLYGREAHLATLLTVFKQVAQAESHLLLITGYSGIGKSSLVQELYKPITEKQGYFIAGKFDQLQRSIPYSALIQAMQSLLQQILSENEFILKKWQQKLQNAVGEHGQLLVEVLPSLALIIGQQTATLALPPQEAQLRFNLTFQNFIRACCDQNHLLTLFIDDLQWIDSATLKLLPLLISDIPYLLLIGAYRDNEVDATHPLISTLRELQDNQLKIQTLTLAPLEITHIQQLLSDSLHRSLSEVKSLAELLLEKSGGNPFFMGEFLKTLYYEELLNFNPQHKLWEWDITQIQQQNITDNVVALLVKKIARLPQASQELLSLAAVLGNRIDLHLLAISAAMNLAEVQQILWFCLEEGFLVPENTTSYKFVHDRIQQAAYSLIADNKRQQVHLNIARLLFQNTPENALETRCFELVEHYNQSIALLTEAEECYRLVELNLIAGQRAKKATAYEPALHYFQQACVCLNNIKDNAAQFNFALEKGKIECYFLLSRIDEGLEQAEALFKKCQQISEKIELNNLLILYYGGAGQMDKAIDIALDSLRFFDVDLPRNPKPWQLILELARAKMNLGWKTSDALMALPVCHDEKIAAIFSLLKELIAPTYLQGLTHLLPYIILRMFNLTLEYGNGPVASFAYSCYALLWSKLGDFAEAYRFGVLAMQYNQHIDNPPMEARCYFMATSFALYWRQPLAHSQQPRKLGLQKLIETGEYFWASYIYLFGFWQEVVLSKSLDKLIRLTKREIRFAQKAKQIEPYYVHTLHHNLFKNLAERTENPQSLSDKADEETQALAYFAQNTTSTMGKFYYAVCRLVLHYYYEEYERALASATPAHITEEVIRDGTYTRVIYTFYTCLSILALADFAQKPTAVHSGYAKLRKKIQQWYALYAENFAVMWYTLLAEEARIQKQDSDAIDFYEQALQAAKQQQSLWFESLVNELTAKFWRNKQNQKMTTVFMTEASYLYYRWGAVRKITYSPSFMQFSSLTLPIASTSKNNLTTSHSGSASTITHQHLDVLSIVKALQTLAGEIQLEKLLQQLLQILLASAGATRGLILLPEKQQWVVQADSDYRDTHELLNIELHHYARLPNTLIYYLIRTQNRVLIDKLSETQFGSDTYFQNNPPLSLLCLPLMQQNRMKGILYLENTLISNAFTPERIELLEMLSGQILISIENALLYRNLEYRVKERTQELSNALSELKTTQKHLVESEKMAALGTLVAGVAHEINNPVNFVHLGTYSLKEGMEKQKQFLFPLLEEELSIVAILEKQYQQLECSLGNIEEGCIRIKTIVDDLRTFSRLDEVERKVVDLIEALKSTIRITQTQYQKRVQIVTDFQAQPELECWSAKLNQAFMNIIVNGCQAIEKQQNEANAPLPGLLTISSFIQEMQGKNELAIRFQDNGCGMNEEVRRKMFEPFFTTKPVGQGTGLGMSLSYGIIQEHHGRIEVASQPGLGTTITVYLPL